MFVNTNIPAFNAQRQLYANNISLDKSLERLSSGLRINTGADDASGLAMAEKMKAQSVGLTSAIQNTQDGAALFKIADGALDQVGRILSRLEELVVRANNRTLTDGDRITLQDEITQLIDQVSIISNNTEYNTLKLLDGNLDIKKNLTVDTPGIPGSMKILQTPGTVKTATNMVLSITSRATPAAVSATVIIQSTPVNLQNSVNINGVDVQISPTDTLNTVLSKINQANSKTNVIAVQVGDYVGLVSGVIDSDSQNIAQGISDASTITVANASAVGYTTVGTAATISLGGDSGIWSWLGYSNALSDYAVSGTNVAGTLGGIKMQASGNILVMEDAGSPMYGIKIGTGMYNEAYGGFVLTGLDAGASLGSAVYYTTANNDQATISTNDSKKVGLQLGANYNQSIAYSLQSTSPDVIGVGASSKLSSLKQVNVITLTDANLSLKVIQKAITDVTTIRATIGATLNRLDYTEKTIRVQRENMQSAESKIRDADMALEMTYYTRNQLLSQTATAMLAQANQRPQSILQLLR
jgi:flagellin